MSTLGNTEYLRWNMRQARLRRQFYWAAAVILTGLVIGSVLGYLVGA